MKLLVSTLLLTLLLVGGWGMLWMKWNRGTGTQAGKLIDGTITTSTKLPSVWPKDILIYPGARVQTAKVVNPASAQGEMSVILESPAKPQAVIVEYRKQLRVDGWTIRNTITPPDTTIFIAAKGTRTISVAITGNSQKTVITIAQFAMKR